MTESAILAIVWQIAALRLLRRPTTESKQQVTWKT